MVVSVFVLVFCFVFLFCCFGVLVLLFVFFLRKPPL